MNKIAVSKINLLAISLNQGFPSGSYVDSIAIKCLRALSGIFSPYLIDQSSCRILITHAKTRPSLHRNCSFRLGENRPYQSPQTYAGNAHVNLELKSGFHRVATCHYLFNQLLEP